MWRNPKLFFFHQLLPLVLFCFHLGLPLLYVGGTTVQMLLWHWFPRVWVPIGMCSANCKVHDFRTEICSSSKTSMKGSVLQWPHKSWPHCECNMESYDSKSLNKLGSTLQPCKLHLKFACTIWYAQVFIGKSILSTTHQPIPNTPITEVG